MIGANDIILVIKHHDGFFLYPTSYTNHTVAYSSWRDGKGDVAKEFVESCRKLGAQPSFYLSPWDRNFYNMTWRPEYNEFYEKTLKDLLTHYGPIAEMWWDGANAQENMTMLYDWKYWYNEVKQYQSNCLATCNGPDAIWAGTESGLGKEENWLAGHGNDIFPSEELVYAPKLLDVTLRGGWFYHPNEKPKSMKELQNIYFKSVGYNYNLQLNIPPTKDGLFCEDDVNRIKEFSEYLHKTFDVDYARLATRFNSTSEREGYYVANVVNADKYLYWIPEGDYTNSGSIELYFDEFITFNVVMMQEYVRGGQTVAKYSIEVYNDGNWKEIQTGTTIGHKKLHLFDSLIKTNGVRLNILDTWNSYPPKITRLGLFISPEI